MSDTVDTIWFDLFLTKQVFKCPRVVMFKLYSIEPYKLDSK